MINPMNVSHPKIKQSTLHGHHEAGIVYAEDVVIDPMHDGVLTCDELFLGKEHVLTAAKNQENLNHDDRIYFGVLRVRDIILRGQSEADESGLDEAPGDATV